MGFLRSLFGPSKEEIWSQIAKDIGGEFTDGGFWGKDALVYKTGEWQIVMDTYTVSSGTGQNRSSTTYTRIRAPFINKDNLQFSIYREGLFSGVAKFFGAQDIQVGDKFFDENFIIKGNNELRIKDLLEDKEIKELINYIPRIHFEIKDDEGWFGTHFPEGTDELYFRCVGVVKDKQLLRDLFELFTRTLERLVEIDSAYEAAPGVTLK